MIADYKSSSKTGTLHSPNRNPSRPLVLLFVRRIWKVSGQVCHYSSKLLSSELVHEIEEKKYAMSLREQVMWASVSSL